MMWIFLFGCGEDAVERANGTTETPPSVMQVQDWMLGFGTSMDGDIEPCG